MPDEPLAERIARREFLYYTWIGSIALALAGGAGIALKFGLPRDRFFTVDEIPSALPELIAFPRSIRNDTFLLSHSEEGLIALHSECTFERCVVRWAPTNNRLECPCSGSKYRLDGSYIEGPARRSLDRFALQIVTPDGILESDEAGNPIPVALESVQEIRINTDRLIERPVRYNSAPSTAP